MSKPPDEPITLYTASWCRQAVDVARYLERLKVPVRLIDIDEDPEARQELRRINHGYASVPTLVFPDGSRLTEPSMADLERRLGSSPEKGLLKRVRAILPRRGGRTDS
jgi:mycoredoxin